MCLRCVLRSYRRWRNYVADLSTSIVLQFANCTPTHATMQAATDATNSNVDWLKITELSPNYRCYFAQSPSLFTYVRLFVHQTAAQLRSRPLGAGADVAQLPSDWLASVTSFHNVNIDQLVRPRGRFVSPVNSLLSQ